MENNYSLKSNFTKFIICCVCICSALGINKKVNAQCDLSAPVDTMAVYIDVTTDDWGYEAYWQLVPTGNGCDTGTIFTGGNLAELNCSSGCSPATATSGNGYPSNTTITEGPFCLPIGQSYDIVYIDDFGDGGATFSVNVVGANNFTGAGCGNTFTFVAQPLPPFDAAAVGSTVNPNFYEYTSTPLSQTAPMTFNGDIKNVGTDTLTGITLNIDINGGLFIAAGSNPFPLAPSATFTIGTAPQFIPSAPGIYNVSHIAVVNEPDANSANDTFMTTINVTDSVYARDNGTQLFELNAKVYGVGGAYQLGNRYEIRNGAIASSITVHLGPSTVVGTQIMGKIYDSTQTNILGTTNLYTVQTSDPGNQVTLQIVSELLLNAGSSCVAVISDNSGTDSAMTVWGHSGALINTSYLHYNDSMLAPLNEIPHVKLNLQPVPPIVVSFTVDSSQGCAPLTVTFTNTTTLKDYFTYTWNFADGSPTYNGVDTSHTYTSPGWFWVTLNAYDSIGNNVGQYGTQVYLEGAQNPIYVSDTLVCPGKQIWFDQWDGSSSKFWDFGDGNTSTNDWGTQHAYSATGTYTVTLVLGFNSCPSDTLTTTVVVTDTIPANATLYVNKTAACPSEQLNFWPAAWDATTFAWDFGDGNTSVLTNPYHTYTVTGTYSVTLTTTNLCGNSATDTLVIIITDTLLPNNNGFSMSVNTACPGKQIEFYSNNWEDDWSWDFGDGYTASSQYPKHTYSTAGVYTITHTMTNACGNQTSVTDSITIDATILPNPGFGYNPNPACPGERVNFNASQWDAKTFNWDFGDGNTSVLQYPFNEYASAGDYAVTLTVTNECGNSATQTDTVSISDSVLIPNWVYSYVYPTEACPGENIQFNASWGFPTYIFDYGDGNIDTVSNNPYQQHTYDSAGTYNTSITIMNYCGIDTTMYDTITINSSMPIPNWVNLNAYPDPVCPGENIQFYGPWGYPSYEWLMDDGSDTIVTSSAYITYSYDTAAVYNVALIVTNFCGDDTTLYDSITVSSTLPVPSFVYMSGWPNPACPGEDVNFNAYSGFSSYVWDFGDSSASVTTSNEQVTHQYDSAGLYNASVTLTNYCGNDTTIYTNIQIDTSIQVPNWLWFNVYPDQVCPQQEVNLNTDWGYASYLWDFGDGYSALGSNNTYYSYDSVGTYDVSVTVSNSCGNSVTLNSTVTVDSAAGFPSWISMWYSPNPVCPGELVTLGTYSGYSTYVWDFGDGDSILTTTGPYIDHAYQAAGDYSASVTIVNGCGDSITVYQTIDVNDDVTIPWLWIDLPNNPSCPGDEVVMNVWGGSNYIYDWDFDDGSGDTTIGTGTSHAYDSVGTYNVVVTATNSCGNSITTSKTVNINNTATPTLYPWTWGTLGESQVIGCPGDAVVFYFEGISDNTWDFGDSTSGVATEVFINDNGQPITIIKHAFSTAGNYTVTLTLTNGCGNSATSSKTFTVSSNLLVNGGLIVDPPTSTSGYTTCSSIGFVAYGGSSYSWDFGDGTIITNSPTPTTTHTYSDAGNYAVNVSITNGCGNTATYSVTMTVTGVGGTTVTASESTAISCFGGSDGSADAGVSGGNTPYTYLWDDSGAQTNATATGLPSGTFNVTVTDNLGCEGLASVTINDPAQIALSSSSTQSSCGSSDGTATVFVVSGGTSPFTYAWSSGGSSATEDSLAVGTYTVTVSDANNCSSSTSTSISEAGGGTVSLDAVTDATCNGDADGAISITLSGGSTPYTYLWSSGDTIEDITGLTAGSYVLTVTDAAGCQASYNTTVSEPDALAITFTTVDADCGSANGSSTANVTGGTSPYTYQWDSNAGSQTNALATSLSANAYDITVTDGSGCTTSATATVSNANAPQITLTVTDISCNGAGDGAISTSVSGGTTPYQYIWTWSGGGSSSPSLSGLEAGAYTLMLQDGSGCWAGMGVTISEPDSISLTTAVTDATCNNTDGVGMVTASGGTSPFTYAWSSSGTSSSETGLAPGDYAITVTDSSGCTASDSISVAVGVPGIEICIITVDTTSTMNIVVWDKPAPNGIDSFRIYRDIVGTYTLVGSQPYGDLSEFMDTTNGINPNTTSYRYKISIVDSCGNEGALSDYHETMHLLVNLGVPPAMNLVWDNYEGITFSYYRILRDTTGTESWEAIDSVSTTNFTYSDATPPQTSTLRYAIEVVHPDGCVASKSKNYNSSKSNTTVNSTAPLAVTGSSTDASTGNCDGTATATVTGGSPTYTYMWNDTNSQTDSVATGLCADTYTCTVVDAAGDTVTVTVTVGGGGSTLAATALGTPENGAGACDGTATVTATGGVSPYTYEWNTSPVQTDSIATGLCAGSYTATVIDANNDTVTAPATVGTTPGILEVGDDNNGILVFPNPYTGQTQISYTLNVPSHVAIEIYNMIGKRISVVADEEQQAGNHLYKFSAANLGYPNGVYLVKLSVGNAVYTERLVELK